MRFSVTKEVGRDEDGGRAGSDPGLGTKTRYRLELAFSRRSSKKKAGAGHKKAAPGFEPPGGTQEYHSCYDCGQVRGTEYHNQHLLPRGQQPKPSLCTLCRRARKVRLVAGARRRGRHSHWSRKCQACIDDWQWCSNCGTLRSARYHEKYMSGSKLPPWAEVCGKCVMSMEEENQRCEELRARLELLDIQEDRASSKRCDPVPQDNHPNPRSRPYAFKPVTSRPKVESIPRSTRTTGTSLKAILSVDSNNRTQRFATKSRSTPVTNSFNMSAGPITKLSICGAIANEGINTSANDHQSAEKRHMLSSKQAEPPRQVIQQEKISTLPEQPEGKPKENPKGDMKEKAKKKSKEKAKTQSYKKAAHISTDTTMNDHCESHPTHRSGQQNQESKYKPFFPSDERQFQSQSHFQVEAQQHHAQHYQEQQPQAHYHQAQHHRGHDYQEQQHPAQCCQEQHHQEQHHQAQHHWEQHNQEQYHQPQAANRPMGISDMYWASPEGQAELKQSFVIDGQFFPGSIFNKNYYGFGTDGDAASHPSTASNSARSSFESGNAGHSSSGPSTGYTTPATESATYSGMDQHKRKNQQREQQKMPKVWEVDSDEEEEIEKSRAKLFAHCKA